MELAIIEHCKYYLSRVRDYIEFPKGQILIDSSFEIDKIIENLIMLKILENKETSDTEKEIIKQIMNISFYGNLYHKLNYKQKHYFNLLFAHPMEPRLPYDDSYLYLSIKKLQKKYTKIDILNDIDILFNSIETFMKEISIQLSLKTLTEMKITNELKIYMENIGRI